MPDGEKMFLYFLKNPLPMKKGTIFVHFRPPFLKTHHASYNTIGNLSFPPVVQVLIYSFGRLTCLEPDMQYEWTI